MDTGDAELYEVFPLVYIGDTEMCEVSLVVDSGNTELYEVFLWVSTGDSGLYNVFRKSILVTAGHTKYTAFWHFHPGLTWRYESIRSTFGGRY